VEAPPTAASAGERHTAWSFGSLPEVMELRKGRDTLIGYPALVDVGDAVELQVFDDPGTARARMREGMGRLFSIALKEPLRFFERNLPDAQRLGLLYSALGSAEELRADLVAATVERACLAEPWPSNAHEFAARVADARPRLNLIGQELARCALAILSEHQAATRKLAQARAFPQAFADIEQQLADLVPRRFVTGTPQAQLAHLPRYLKAIGMRIDKLRTDSARDAQKMGELAPLLANHRRLLAQRKGEPDPRLDEFRWLLEELRVSLFAQELRTPMPVSVKRLHKAWAAIAG
jgi:ATP-dependent helicase HrpA